MFRLTNYSVALLAPVMLSIGAAPLAAQLTRPPITRPTVLAGPSWLTAAGFIPTSIMLKWRAVPNARFYQVFRAVGTGTKQVVTELDANLASIQDMEGGFFFHIDAVDLTTVFSYEVRAVFLDAAGARIFSSPSPSASSASAPFVAPSNFSFTAAPSALMGRMKITFNWTPVPNAQQYALVFTPLGGQSQPLNPVTATRPPFAIDNVGPRSRYQACIITVYTPTIRDNNVRSCIELKF